ncbi:50S ribosomal protein L1 [bacterium]|nr:50S ribosomal protein L1 [bacterium]
MARGKKYKDISGKLEKGRAYSIEEALEFIKENKAAKFDESVEVHIRLNVDPKKGEEQVRGAVVLPYGTGKIKKIAVITSTKAKEAKEAGADLVGGEDLIEKIKSGKMDFDILTVTPEMMPKLAPAAKILGPKGLMPSPKTETVTEKIKETVETLKKGKVSFKNDNTSNIHQIIGKISFGSEKLKENFDAFTEAVKKSKPNAVKGKFIASVSICSTMGAGIRISSS